MKTLLVGLVLAEFALLGQAPTPTLPSPSLVKSVGNFIHAVADLDQSVRFYRDVLGMEMPRPPGDWQTGAEVLKMYGATGGKYRVANAQVPGVAMRVELAEFAGVKRKPVRRELGDPGALVLILEVPDLQPVSDRLKSANVATKELGGCDGARGISISDPDGFPILVVRWKDAGTIPTPKSFVGLHFGIYAGNGKAWTATWMALGQNLAHPDFWDCNTLEQGLTSGLESFLRVVAPPSERSGNAIPADGLGPSFITLYGAQPRRAVKISSPHDPGSAVLRLAVTDAAAAVAALGKVGVKVVSEGGAIQTLPPAGTKATILQAPDGLFIQVVQ